MYVVVVGSIGTTTNTIKYQHSHTHWVERLFPEHFYGAKLMRPFFLCCTVVLILISFGNFYLCWYYELTHLDDISSMSKNSSIWTRSPFIS